MRALQGLSAALMSPAALSIVLVTYREGHERNTALSVWGAVASGGAAAGVLLGGIITEYWGWRWNFFINVPVAIGVIIAAWKLLPAHESEETHKEHDLPGAISITGALMALVYALVEAPGKGWTSQSTIVCLAVAVVLLAFFIWNERRAEHPLVPFKIFRIRNVTAANIVQMPIVAGMFSTFFFVSLYAQTVLGFSPVKTGVSFLAVPLAIGISASQVPKLVKKIGFKPILMVAPLIVACGLFYLSHIRVGGNYWHDLFPGLVLLGIGMGGNFVAITIAATSGVSGRESGLASGLLNTSQQIGGAIGLAILTGVATSTAAHYVKHLATAPNALTPLAAQVHGMHSAFLFATGFMVSASILAAILLKQPKPTAKASAENAAIGMH
jgi:EmrB/QacA subfamily drug resistance transporter